MDFKSVFEILNSNLEMYLAGRGQLLQHLWCGEAGQEVLQVQGGAVLRSGVPATSLVHAQEELCPTLGPVPNPVAFPIEGKH